MGSVRRIWLFVAQVELIYGQKCKGGHRLGKFQNNFHGPLKDQSGFVWRKNLNHLKEQNNFVVRLVRKSFAASSGTRGRKQYNIRED